MALLEGLEIYIPKEAEVRRVPLHALSSSMLRKMNLSVESAESAKPSDCVWICPAQLQRKGQKENAQGQARAKQHMMTVLRKHTSSTSDSAQWNMSFLTADVRVYGILQETLPVSQHKSLFGTSNIPQGTVSNSEQDTIIIYDRRVYLFMKRKKSAHSKSQQPGPDQSSAHSQRAPLIQGQLKRKLSAPCDATEMPQPKLSDCRPQEARHSLGASPVVRLGQEANPWAGQGSRQTAHWTSSGANQESCQSFGDGLEVFLGATQKDQGHGASLGAGMGASTDQRPQEESSDQSPSQSPYSGTHCYSPSWAVSEPPALPDWGPSEPSAQQQEFDFQELERKERIARMEAQLLKRDGALNSL